MPDSRRFIHIRLPPEVYLDAKTYAEEHDLSMSRVVERALAAYMRTSGRKDSRHKPFEYGKDR